MTPTLPCTVATPETNPRPILQWGFFLLLLLALVAVYLPAMQGQFLMSDMRVVADNSRLTSLAGLLSVWSPAPSNVYPAMDQYQPLTYTLFWLERQLFGHEPRAYQAVSIVLHALNAFLVWRLLARIGVRGAAVAAVIFALHAVHVESVAWIYEQKNPLSGVFFFLALLAYLRFDVERRRRWYAAALGCFAAALLSKSSTVVLPALIVLYAWFRREPLFGPSFIASLPFFGMAVLMAGLTIWYEGTVTGASGELYSAGALERLARAGWVVGFHAGKLALPLDLAFFYPSWSVDASSWTAYLPNLSIAAALGAAWLHRDGWGRPALLGIGWYLVLMFPVMGFFDIFYHQFSLAADHFQYLGSVGLIALGVHTATTALEKAGSAAEKAGPVRGALATAIVVALLGIGAWQRSHVFANNGELSRDSADKYPTSWLAFQKSGEHLLRRVVRGAGNADSQLSRAVQDLERAVTLRPSHPQSHDSLATAYSLVGDLDAAQRHAEIAVELEPGDWNLHRNLAISLAEQQQPEAALDRYRMMAAVAPHSPEARLVLAQALVETGRFDEAIAAIDIVTEQASALLPIKPQMAAVMRRAFDLKVAATALREKGDDR